VQYQVLPGASPIARVLHQVAAAVPYDLWVYATTRPGPEEGRGRKLSYGESMSGGVLGMRSQCGHFGAEIDLGTGETRGEDTGWDRWTRPPEAIGRLLVTRHQAFAAYLREIGLGGEVIEHVAPDCVRGRDVVGVIPMHLAAQAHSVTAVGLRPTPADQGELSLDRLRAIAMAPQTYTVMRGWQPVAAAIARALEFVGGSPTYVWRGDLLEIRRADRRAVVELYGGLLAMATERSRLAWTTATGQSVTCPPSVMAGGEPVDHRLARTMANLHANRMAAINAALDGLG